MIDTLSQLSVCSLQQHTEILLVILRDSKSLSLFWKVILEDSVLFLSSALLYHVCNQRDVLSLWTKASLYTFQHCQKRVGSPSHTHQCEHKLPSAAHEEIAPWNCSSAKPLWVPTLHWGPGRLVLKAAIYTRDSTKIPLLGSKSVSWDYFQLAFLGEARF